MIKNNNFGGKLKINPCLQQENLDLDSPGRSVALMMSRGILGDSLGTGLVPKVAGYRRNESGAVSNKKGENENSVT